MMIVEYWHWMVMGLSLILLEILTPGFYFLWIGLAGFITGIIKLIFPGMDFVYLGTIFAALSVAFCYFGRVSLYKKIKSDAPSTLNRRGEQYIGTKVVVTEAIKNGKGKIKVGDTIWSATCESDKKEGSTVKIVGVSGTIFTVE